MAGHPKKFGKTTYYEYMAEERKVNAQSEARRLRKTGKWLVRISKIKGGYMIYTKPK